MPPTNHISRPERLALAALAFGLAAVVCGCGDDRARVHPVSGRVLVEGEPAGGAVVIFYPQTEDLERKKFRPNAETDEEGNFQVTTYVQGDGAPPGDYLVSVVWNSWSKVEPSPDGMEDDETKVSQVVDRLRGRYEDPQASGISVTIERGENVLPPFELE